ncbi:MAG: DUF4282 domain-containing protein [Ignavibacteriae bacterium]|nr:DUF4282 domain-containing protein [Ignavibacteriota bacterium]
MANIFKNFFNFNKLVTTQLIKVIYIIGIIIIILGFVITILFQVLTLLGVSNVATVKEFGFGVMGIIGFIILGFILTFIFLLMWRMFCEGIILKFITYEKLVSIDAKLSK